jgi:hypothetical protein
VPAKFQFVDQGPELENYYSQDDFAVTSSGDTIEDRRPDDAVVPSKRVELAFDAEVSPSVHSAPSSELPYLSPSTSHHEFTLVHSPIKRRRTADSSPTQYAPNSGQVPQGIYDPIRSQYRIYDHPKVFNPLSPDGFTYMSKQHYIPKVVEAEYRRLADDAAAQIPSEPLLSPAIWKEEFYWPNKYTTTQCACLMRYYIEHLASWVGSGSAFQPIIC